MLRFRSLDEPEDEMVVASFVGTSLKQALDSLSEADRSLELALLNMGLREDDEPPWYRPLRRRIVMLRWLCTRVYARTGASYGLMPKHWSGQMIPVPPRE